MYVTGYVFELLALSYWSNTAGHYSPPSSGRSAAHQRRDQRSSTCPWVGLQTQRTLDGVHLHPRLAAGSVEPGRGLVHLHTESERNPNKHVHMGQVLFTLVG